MKVIYQPLTVDEAFELIKEDDKRKDLFFENSEKHSPQVLKNLHYHTFDLVKINKVIWFQRKVEGDTE